MCAKFRIYHIPILMMATLVSGETYDTNEFPAKFERDMLTIMLKHVIEMGRQGLIEANWENITMPDVSWSLESEFLGATVHTSELIVYNIPDFRLLNLTTDIITMRAEVDIEFPLITAGGVYVLTVTFFGFPICSFEGEFEMSLSKLKFNGAGHLKAGIYGGPNYIHVSNPFQTPFVSLEGVHIIADEVPGPLVLIYLFLILFALTFIYTMIVVIITRIAVRRKRRRERLYDRVSTQNKDSEDISGNS